MYNADMNLNANCETLDYNQHKWFKMDTFFVNIECCRSMN